MRYPRLALATCALILLTSGCGSPGKVGVTLDEFKLTVRPSMVASHRPFFQIRNVGQVAHEFVVLRTDRAPGRLPIRNQQVDTSVPGIRVVRTITHIRPGATRDVRLALTPGRYALICNVPAHYSSGMHAGLRVTGGVAAAS